MTFWNSWELWEKLCFILAAGIVIVIILGCGKLVHNSWRLRKYAKIKADTMALKRKLMHSRSVKRGRAKEVPFGIRALEKGVVVEGVWNSGANTPAPSTPGSPIIPVVEAVQKPYQDSSASSISSVQSKKETRKPSRQLDPPPLSGASTRNRKQYKPRRASGLRISNALSDIDRGEVLAELNAQEGAKSDQTKPSPASSASGKDSQPENEPTQQIFYQHSPAASSYVSAESNPFLDSAASRNSYDESIAPTHLNSLVPNEFPHNDDRGAYHAQLLQGAQITYGAGHALPSSFAMMPTGALDEQSAPLCPIHEALDPLPTLHALEGEVCTCKERVAREPQMVAKLNSEFEVLTREPLEGSVPRGPSQDRRASQVVRKVNSGFEILAPGTFGPVQSMELGNSWRESQSLGSALGSAKEEKRKSGRKLQKKGKRESLLQQGG